MNEETKAVISVREAAQLLGLHEETIRRAVRRGELKACRLGHRTLRISRADLEAYFRAHGGGALFVEEAGARKLRPQVPAGAEAPEPRRRPELIEAPRAEARAEEASRPEAERPGSEQAEARPRPEVRGLVAEERVGEPREAPAAALAGIKKP